MTAIAALGAVGMAVVSVVFAVRWANVRRSLDNAERDFDNCRALSLQQSKRVVALEKIVRARDAAIRECEADIIDAVITSPSGDVAGVVRRRFKRMFAGPEADTDHIQTTVPVDVTPDEATD